MESATTYIPAVLTVPSQNRIIRNSDDVEAKQVTKRLLKQALADDVLIEYISRSQFHRYGAHFTGAEAFKTYGAVGIEVRTERGTLLAVVYYSDHPTFGGKPEKVGAVVR
jgi:hypothetical protein